MIRILAVLLFMPVVASAQATFQLPSGNIQCAVYASDRSSLICTVRGFSYAIPPRPPNCDINWGNVVMLGGTGPARLICAGDPGEARYDPVLRYGQAWQGPGMTCTSAQTGLRCQNAEGRGFEMARARLRFF